MWNCALVRKLVKTITIVPRNFFIFFIFKISGTGNNAGGCAAYVRHLPFAGITLFRFNGCNLSLSIVSGSTPGIKISPTKLIREI